MEQEYKVMFDIRELLPIGFAIIVLGVGLSYGLQVMGDIKSDMTANSYEANATTDTITAVAKIPAKLGTVVTVIMAAVVIGVLLTYLYARFVK